MKDLISQYRNLIMLMVILLFAIALVAVFVAADPAGYFKERSYMKASFENRIAIERAETEKQIAIIQAEAEAEITRIQSVDDEPQRDNSDDTGSAGSAGSAEDAVEVPADEPEPAQKPPDDDAVKEA